MPMRRRAAFALCAGAVFSGIPAVGADKAPAVIGVLALTEQNCRNESFLGGMRDLGYIEGRDFRIVCRHAEGHYDRLPQATQSLLKENPTVILTLGQAYTSAATRATKEIPIVMVTSSDPVASGFASSYARPGGNATGYTYYGDQLTAKRLELLKNLVPNLRQVATLNNPEVSQELQTIYRRDVENAARELRLQVTSYDARNELEIERAFEAMAGDRMQAVYILPYFTFAEHAQQLADLARFHNLPSIHFIRRYPAFGGLMSYGPDYDMLHRRTANYVDKILRGAKPGDLPIDKPERLDLIINRATANEHGLKIPSSLLLRADRVID